GHLHAHVDNSCVEELHFIDAEHSYPERNLGSQFFGVDDGIRIQPAIVARDDPLHIEAIVDHRLEDLRSLAGDLGAPDAADQLFALAAEHAAGYYFDPSASWVESVIHLLSCSFFCCDHHAS